MRMLKNKRLQRHVTRHYLDPAAQNAQDYGAAGLAGGWAHFVDFISEDLVTIDGRLMTGKA